MKRNKKIEKTQKINNFEFLDIEEIVQQNLKKVELVDSNELIYRVRAATGLSLEQSKIILNLFFQEIRSLMLKGTGITLQNVGTFFISSPASKNNKVKILLKFRISNNLLKKMNS